MADDNPWASPPEPDPNRAPQEGPQQGPPPAYGYPPQVPQQGAPPPGYPGGPPSYGYPPQYPQQYPQQGPPPPGYPGGPAPYGYPGYGGYAYPAGPRTSGRATAVLVLGIVSLVSWCFYGVGIIPAIISLSLAPGAKREIRSSGGMVEGEGQVKAGVICSWIAIGLAILAVIAVVILIIYAANQPTYRYRNGPVY